MLTEAQAKGFDKAKPGNWPVLETKIKDAVTAEFKKGFLQSIFERAIDEGDRTQLKVSRAFEKKAPLIFNIDDIYNSTIKKKADLKNGVLPEFKKFIVRKCTRWYVDGSSEIHPDDIEKVTNFLAECLENLEKPWNEGEFRRNSEWTELFYKREGLASSTNPKLLFLKDKGTVGKQFVMDVQKKLADATTLAESKKRRYIDFEWGEEGDNGGDLFKLELDVDFAKGGDLEDGIINFKCRNLIFAIQSQYENEEGENEDNKWYAALGGDDMKEIDGEGITFGQVMSWLNVWQKTGKSNPELLSTTGKDAYADACKEIFGSEEAASLPAFASASVKIGAQTVKLANSKSDGTIVPVLALNKVVGTVGFAYNSSEISDTGLKSLKEKDIWTALSSAKSSIIIVGNTDTSGTPEYNKSLSVKRAEAVLAVLSKDTRFSKLKATKNVTTRGDGKQYPLAPDDKGKNQEAAASNRRVELIIDDKEASDKLKQK